LRVCGGVFGALGEGGWGEEGGGAGWMLGGGAG